MVAYDAATGLMKPIDVALGAESARKKNYEHMMKWSTRLFDHTFA